jgi:hypothetical protein
MIELNRPIFGNIAKTAAKTVAKISKLKLIVQKSYIKLLLNVKISKTNHILKLLLINKENLRQSGHTAQVRHCWS